MSELKGCDGHENHSHSIFEELVTHFPYAIFSLATGMIILSFLSFFAFLPGNQGALHDSCEMLFHSFHFLHIIFAVTGAMITFFRYSKNVFLGVTLSGISSVFFCLLSDIFMPYLSGRVLGLNMEFHFCFFDELHNVLPFLFVGLINGYLMSRHCQTKQTVYSLGSHFSHIFVSALASLFYMAAHGLDNWTSNMGSLFLLLIIAVLVPCTLSDLVFPMWYARLGKKGEC